MHRTRWMLLFLLCGLHSVHGFVDVPTNHSVHLWKDSSVHPLPENQFKATQTFTFREVYFRSLRLASVTHLGMASLAHRPAPTRRRWGTGDKDRPSLNTLYHAHCLWRNNGKCIIPNPVDSYLIPIPTVMSAWVEHGEFACLWFCALKKNACVLDNWCSRHWCVHVWTNLTVDVDQFDNCFR